jgi:hypothetical protein
MKREDAGGQCEFNRILTGLRLQPCGVAARPTRRYEKWLHSHPGEGISLAYGIAKWRHVLFARAFTNIGDCSGLQWIMPYEGTNPVIHRIQMELMPWWFTVVHRPGRMMVGEDYLSRLHLDGEIHIDPILNQYMQISYQNRIDNPPASSSEEVLPENLPSFRRNTKSSLEFPPSIPSIPSVSIAITHQPISNRALINIPITFTNSPQVHTSQSTTHHNTCALAAFQLQQFEWILYGFGSGHFNTTCKTHLIPFSTKIAADPSFQGRSFLRSYSNASIILDSAVNLLKYIRTQTQILIQGYYITCPLVLDTQSQHHFFRTQSTIVEELRT